MTQLYIVNGNIQFAPAPDAQNATIPISQQIAFTQLHVDQLVYNAPASNQPIALGTMTNPKAVYIEIISGSCTLKLNTADVGVINLGLGATPQVTDRSNFTMSNPTGLGALAMVLTVAQACVLKIYAVQ
jgi:hypothetical protein